jgi:hypothetical protein
MLNRSRCLIVLTFALALLAIPTTASAARGSIFPASYVRASFGGEAYVTDLEFVGDTPCVLVGADNAPEVPTVKIGCGTRLGTKKTIDLTPNKEFPTAFDSSAGKLDIVGWTEPSNAMRPFLFRTDSAGVPVATFGVGGVASLDALAPSGLQRVRLTAVETLADGSIIVGGDARATENGNVVGFVMKVTNTGALDGSFGVGGVREISVPGFVRSGPNDLRVLDDGTILLVGWSSNSPTSAFAPWSALVDAAGALVPGYGTAGVAKATFSTNASFAALPDTANAGTWPMTVSGSSNSKGNVKPWVVQLQQTGQLVAAWGGPGSHKTVTVTGDAQAAQGMDIERLADGSFVGGAEMDTNGDSDVFVSRFKASSGVPDTAWSTGGFEPIDTVLGKLDSEWTAAIAISPNGQIWSTGVSTIGNVSSVHLFRVRGTGSATAARWSGGGVFALEADGDIRKCGTTLRAACVVPRGTRLFTAASLLGWDATGSPLLRPNFHIWSKVARKPWVMHEQTGAPKRSGSVSVLLARLSLPVGSHEISAHRNGGATFGAAWTKPLYVKVV